MISLEGKRLASHWLRLIAATMLLPLGCAKSQQNPDSTHSAPAKTPDSAESLLWIDDIGSDTTRSRYGEFELIEIEGQAEDQLIGYFEGKSVTVIAGKQGLCLQVVSQNDFDQDGWEDLLMGNLSACSGHCCPDQFFVVSYRGQGQYLRSKPQGLALHQPEVSTWQGKPSIIIENGTLDGYDTYATKERFVVEEGELKSVEVLKPKEIDALQECRVETYDTLPRNEAMGMTFDLDSDGKVDTITGKYWPQWSRVMWSVKFGNGQQMEGGPPFKRLGILSSKTEGHFELVVDRDRVLEWTGKRYEEREE